jgi:hypothetical protein
VDRRTIVCLSLGALSAACVVGFNPRAENPPVIVEPLAGGEDLGVIHGALRDKDTGEPLADALVILHCSCLAGDREFDADAAGVYRFRHLPPGSYTIQVLINEANVNRSVVLGPGVQVRADFRFKPGKKFRLD